MADSDKLIESPWDDPLNDFPEGNGFKTFTSRLDWCLDQRSVSQSEMARHTPVSKASVTFWRKHPETKPRRGTVNSLAKYLNVDKVWLDTGEINEAQEVARSMILNTRCPLFRSKDLGEFLGWFNLDYATAVKEQVEKNEREFHNALRHAKTFEGMPSVPKPDQSFDAVFATIMPDDSMFPLIPSDAVMFVDVADAKPKPMSIYLIVLDEEYMVRQYKGGRRHYLRTISDDEDERVYVDEGVQVIGRVAHMTMEL